MTPASATPPNCLLTLALPKALEEELLDALQNQRDLVPGFSLVQAQGIGQDAPLVSAIERVEGRARRVLVQIAMDSQDVDRLLARLRQTLPSPAIAFWVTPLLRFGRLA